MRPRAPDGFERRVRYYTPERIAPFNRANRAYPKARATERRLMVELLDPSSGMLVVDTMAGGGYLAEGLRVYADRLRLVCVDPSTSFVNSIDTESARLVCPMDALGLRSDVADRVANLAGIHHLDRKQDFFHEAFRILKPGGVFAVADVRTGTPTAAWLNGPVDRMSDIGHDGTFIAPKEAESMLHAAGFDAIRERHEEYTWDFPSLHACAVFARDLFRLSKASLADVTHAIRSTLPLRRARTGIALGWSLTYARGTKP